MRQQKTDVYLISGTPLFWNGDFRRDSSGVLSAGFRSSDDSQLCMITVTLIDREGKIISATEKLLLTGK